VHVGVSQTRNGDRASGPRRPRALVALVAAIVTTAAGLVAYGPAGQAEALSGADFNPGMIITDDLFYDSHAMTSAQIQAFLDREIGSCANGQCLNVATINFSGTPTHTSTSTGNLICTAIAGGTIRISELIYRTQVACGISAKVILVTLQKEQGLVTSRAPSDTALAHAMGMACPDTAPCDTAFAGLARQIVSGTDQLKTYKAAAFARQPGVSYIQYSPNASCGGTYVNLQNYATAALYNYTPYQPNAPALANLGGTGDSCSSYGNRNFWNYFNVWFGPTSYVDGAVRIAAEYTRAGGTSGPLGASLAVRPCPLGSSTCYQDYQGGLIGWSNSGGAWTILDGAVRDAYLAAGGPGGSWGMPTSLDNPIDSSATGAGHGQNFQNVQALAKGTGAVIALPLTLQAVYSSLGWVRGALGWPVSSAVCSGTNCVQQFEGGMLANTAVEAFQIRAAVLDAYKGAGGPSGSWGFPTSSENPIDSPRGNGSGENFEHVQVLSSAGGIHAVAPQLLPQYSSLGWVRGALGWPVADAACSSSNCAQEFQGGVLANVGSQFLQVTGPIMTAYHASGGVIGAWGMPSSASSALDTPSGAGLGQNFQNGQALSSSAGAFFVSGRILTAFSAAGWIRGSLGWPLADAVCVSSGACTQKFQGGSISAPAGSGPATIALG